MSPVAYIIIAIVVLLVGIIVTALVTKKGCRQLYQV